MKRMENDFSNFVTWSRIGASSVARQELKKKHLKNIYLPMLLPETQTRKASKTVNASRGCICLCGGRNE